jgi:hypothetical protein
MTYVDVCETRRLRDPAVALGLNLGDCISCESFSSQLRRPSLTPTSLQPHPVE